MSNANVAVRLWVGEQAEKDREVETMVNQAVAARRASGEVVQIYRDVPEEKPVFETRWDNLRRIGSVGVRVLIGLMFIGAIVRGLINPILGGILAAACIPWALYRLRR
ncbi:MAG: hypothetical protein J6A26_04795 [Oscillospiraceae bacterium]|nr:hypothetical protein [Oscillospiraceae bacterium]